MRKQGLHLIRLMPACVLLVLGTGCQTLPTGTQTGKVHDILITEAGPEPRDVAVQIGDEIRFVNERRFPSYVTFFQDYRDELACRRGFKYVWGTEEGSQIAPGESASVCFSRTVTVGYKVQFEPTKIGGVIGSPGDIIVPPGYPGAIIVE
jgi:plastocyanin